MTFENFVELVRRMRKAQKEYFEYRDQGRLADAKHFERQVDSAIKEITSPPTLFDPRKETP